MIKPKRLRRGSRIAVISPSSGVPHIFPGIYELGLKKMEETFGFEIIEMPTARMSPEELYTSPRKRAEDLNACFADDGIDGIITSIGGYESVRILPYLDEDAILQNPKFIMGFSDATTFLSYLNVLGMVTFYGPAVMAGFAQIGNLPGAFDAQLKAFFFSEDFPYEYLPFERWTNGYKDWAVEETLGQCDTFHDNTEGWTFLQGSRAVEGELWGGCIEVLEFLKGTRYWPDPSFWEGKMLFFETSEEKPSPQAVGYMLRNYGMQGIFRKVDGVLFGRPKDYTDEEKAELHEVVQSVVREEFGESELPIAMNLDFGHTDPKWILPFGGKVRLSPREKAFQLLESPFR
ncbi:MAG TPA: S66 peptidase family protein [Bacillales bacterium]|nr:S66 peptidase family protein [Bacillales bacterium]